MRKNYKEILTSDIVKRGQVTIFIILAVVIVGIVVFFAIYRGVDIIPSSEVNPSSFLRDCISPELDKNLDILIKQGGYLKPDHYLTYKDEKIQYLCYTDSDYEPCRVQQPLLVNHIEKELNGAISGVARDCVSLLVEEYQRKGFQVESSPGEVNVSIEPGNIVLDFVSPMTITKENTQTFQRFGVSKKSELYDLLLTATSIIQFESSLGDSETLLYMEYYPDLKIEKVRRSPDRIYTLSNVVSGDKFTFATRSLVWPQGYGLGA